MRASTPAEWDLFKETPLCAVVDMDGEEFRYLCVAVFKRARGGQVIWVDHDWSNRCRFPFHALVSKPHWDAVERCRKVGSVTFYKVIDGTFKGRTIKSVLDDLASRPEVAYLAKNIVTEHEYLQNTVEKQFGPVNVVRRQKRLYCPVV